MAFAGCGLPVLGVHVLLVSGKLAKSDQLREAGDCFPLPRAAGKLSGDIGPQALLHHTRRLGTPISVCSRAASPSHAAGPLWEWRLRTGRWHGGREAYSTPASAA